MVVVTCWLWLLVGCCYLLVVVTCWLLLVVGCGSLVVVVVVVVVVPSDPSFARIFSHVLPNGNLVFMCILYTGWGFSCMWRRGLF